MEKFLDELARSVAVANSRREIIARVSRLLFLGFGFVARSVRADPQIASPACASCRDNCVNQRESCKRQACERSGGKNAQSSCGGVKNQKVFSDGLAACSNAEGVCKDRCNAGPCR